MKNSTYNMNGTDRTRQWSYLLFFILFFSTLLQAKAQEGSSAKSPQYLYDAFVKGIVVKKSGDNIAAMLNYNIVSEEMIYESKVGYLALGGLEAIDTVYLPNRVFIPYGKIFLEVIYNAPVSLLIQNQGSLTVKGEDVGYGGTSQTSRVTTLGSVQSSGVSYSLDLPDNNKVSVSNIYWIRREGDMKKFNNERSFLNIFPDNKIELKKFIKDENLDMKNTDQLILLMEYCNKIIN